MKNKAENIAIIDIGSNSVRLFIFKINGKIAEQISAKKYFCGLGKDLGITGKLNPEAVALTHQYLSSFREEINKHHIETELVIGTAALREAQDAADFLHDAKQKSGFEIEIISGEEEARLAALAVISNNPRVSGIVADFGGGSLELAKINNGNIEKKITLRLGAHYLKVLPNREKVIDQTFEALLKDNPEFLQVERIYMIGGSWRSLAKAWLQDQGMEGQKLEGFIFPATDILNFCATLQKREPNELVERYQIEIPRAQIMDVSSLMLAKIISKLEPGKIEVSTAGIRDGLAYDYISKHRE